MGQLAPHIEAFLAHYGYFAVFGLLTLGIVGPWIPDETILVLAGIAVHRGQLQLNTTILAAFGGSLCGITLSYLLGRTGAIYALERYEPLHRWVGRHLPQVEGLVSALREMDSLLRLLHRRCSPFHGARGGDE